MFDPAKVPDRIHQAFATNERHRLEIEQANALPDVASIACFHCGHSSGFPREADAVARGGFIRVSRGGTNEYACSRGCLARYEWARAHSIDLPAAVLRDAPPARAATTSEAYQESLEQAVRHVRCAVCSSDLRVDVTRPKGSTVWTPDVEAIAKHAGFVVYDGVRYCGEGCAKRRHIPAPAPVVAVTEPSPLGPRRTVLAGREVKTTAAIAKAAKR